MKRMLLLLMICLLFGYKTKDVYVETYDYLLFEYQGYRIETHFYVDSYVLKEEEENYILHAITNDRHELELKWNKRFNGNIEVKETIKSKGYEYTYYMKKSSDKILEGTMYGDNMVLNYETEFNDDYCCFKGCLDLLSNTNIDLGYDFYIDENGHRRKDIDKSFYVNIQKL